MNTEEAQDSIEKAIHSGRQMLINYTKSKGESADYKIYHIIRTSDQNFNSKATPEPGKEQRPFYKLRYDRINTINFLDDELEVHDQVIDKIRNNSLFEPETDTILRRGGIKGYRSSINSISNAPRAISKLEAKELIAKIDLPVLENWERAVMLNIEDGDTFEILRESDPRTSYWTRLFGVDAPESSEDSDDHILGLEATIFVEKLFSVSRYCYVKNRGIDAYKRHLMDVKSHTNKDVSICLLESGLGIPMMGYLEDVQLQETFIESTKKAYDNRLGVWALEEIHQRYNNIIFDTHTTEFDLMRHIPDKKSVFAKYINQSPSPKLSKLL